MARLVGDTVSSTLVATGRRAIPDRVCGAIALSKVLQSFGIARSVEALWTQVARPDPFGTHAARSYRLAAYAISCGLEAVTVQCHSERWQEALHWVCRHKLAVILNHQAAHAPSEGHYSVLSGMNEATVMLEDPFKGPGQSVALDRMQSLWHPNRETVGFVLVAIGPSVQQPNAVDHAETPDCPACGTRLPLAPSPMFNERDWQAGGLWQRFFCHGCDAGFAPKQT